MKRNILFSTIVALMGLFITTSCVDDMLEQSNPNGINKEDYFTNLDESETALNALYGTMRNHWIVSAKAESFRADIAHPGRRSGNVNATEENYNQTFINTSTDLDKKWAAYYEGIFRANQLIEGLNKMRKNLDASNEELLIRWEEQMGQARFFRGLYHFYAHSLYNGGKILIRDTVPVRLTDFDTPLSESEDVISFFRSDLEYAFEKLPLTFDESGKVTKGTAATILGTSHLYEQEYELAKGYFDKVINEYGYELEYDMAKIFTDAGEFNSESIMEVAFSSEFLPELSQWDESSFHNRWAREFAPWKYKGSTTIVPSAWLSWEYTNEPLDPKDERNLAKDYDGDGNPDLRGVSLRASAMVALAPDFEREYYLYPAPVYGNMFQNLTPAFWKKYTNHDITDNENTVMGTNWKSPCNIVMNRLSDVMLMQAECLLLGDGDVDGALKLINDVRRRWGLVLLGTEAQSDKYNAVDHTFDDVAYDVASLMQHLMYKERPLELSAEGHSIRAIDMRRWQEVPELNFTIKGRFEFLNSDLYHLVTYTFPEPIPNVDKPGKTVSSRAACHIQKGAANDSENETAVAMPNEFGNAANFFTDDKAYLPIPLSEIQNNQAL